MLGLRAEIMNGPHPRILLHVGLGKTLEPQNFFVDANYFWPERASSVREKMDYFYVDVFGLTRLEALYRDRLTIVRAVDISQIGQINSLDDLLVPDDKLKKVSRHTFAAAVQFRSDRRRRADTLSFRLMPRWASAMGARRHAPHVHRHGTGQQGAAGLERLSVTPQNGKTELRHGKGVNRTLVLGIEVTEGSALDRRARHRQVPQPTRLFRELSLLHRQNVIRYPFSNREAGHDRP